MGTAPLESDAKRTNGANCLRLEISGHGLGRTAMPKVSGHSGLPESVELRQMTEKAEQMAEKRREQLSAIYSVLDHMTQAERCRLLLEVIRHYRRD